MAAPEKASEYNRDKAKMIFVNKVKLCLREVNLHGRIATRKPLQQRGNRKKRLGWAIVIQRMTIGGI